MALQKQIELENGVILNYHRITSINKITNHSIVVEVDSYTSEAQRQKEQAYQALQNKNAENEESLTEGEREQLESGIDVFIYTDYIDMPYSENITIKEIYDYLLTLDKYKGAQNV